MTEKTLREAGRLYDELRYRRAYRKALLDFAKNPQTITKELRYTDPEGMYQPFYITIPEYIVANEARRQAAELDKEITKLEQQFKDL